MQGGTSRTAMVAVAALRYLTAALLLVAAAAKLSDWHGALATARTIAWLPPLLAVPVVLGVVGFEGTAGVLLLRRRSAGVGAGLACLAGLAFVAVQLEAPVTSDCGCLGDWFRLEPWQRLWLSLVLITSGLAVLVALAGGSAAWRPIDRRAPAIGLLVVAGGVALVLVARQRGANVGLPAEAAAMPAQTAAVQVGDRLEPLPLQYDDGTPGRLAPGGSPCRLLLFARWRCDACGSALRELQSLAEQWPDALAPLVVFDPALPPEADARERIRELRAQYGLTLPVAVDLGLSLHERLADAPFLWPFALLIDGDNRVRHRFDLHTWDGRRLPDLLAPLLEDVPLGEGSSRGGLLVGRRLPAVKVGVAGKVAMLIDVAGDGDTVLSTVDLRCGTCVATLELMGGVAVEHPEWRFVLLLQDRAQAAEAAALLGEVGERVVLAVDLEHWSPRSGLPLSSHLWVRGGRAQAMGRDLRELLKRASAWD